MNGSKLWSLFKSRRFWAAVAALLVNVAAFLGVTSEADQETIFNMTMLVASWILGDSWRKTV